MLACHVSIIHDTQGPSNTITCGHSSAGLALAEATRTIQRNQADLALVGGCESKVHPMGLMRWSLLHRLNTLCNDNPADAYRPYDKSAGGIILSEGGAVFVIEELEHAKRRGATIYAEVAGFGLSASASANPIDPDPTGEAPAVAIKKAFKDSGVHADQIDMLVPSAYNVPEWDKIDTLALRQALGSSFSNPTVLLGRAGIGDCGAGSQALDLAAGMLAIHQQAIPPAPAFIRDPIDALSLPRHKLSKPIHTALVNMVSLGGQNCAVILKKVS
jgi:3-oxoacyl-[acyl-carrier-protein] synthase II